MKDSITSKLTVVTPDCRGVTERSLSTLVADNHLRSTKESMEIAQ